MPLRPARTGRGGVIRAPVAKTAVVAAAVTPEPAPVAKTAADPLVRVVARDSRAWITAGTRGAGVLSVGAPVGLMWLVRSGSLASLLVLLRSAPENRQGPCASESQLIRKSGSCRARGSSRRSSAEPDGGGAGGSGGGFEGDRVAECFELTDVVAAAAVGSVRVA